MNITIETAPLRSTADITRGIRIAVALGGTDRGRSGLGSYVRAVLPRLARRVGEAGGTLVAMGTDREFEAYAADLGQVERGRCVVPESPAASALWHLGLAGTQARRLGADVLLLPAANRRATLRSPVPTVAVVHDLAALRVRGKYDALRTAYVRHGVVAALRSADRLVAISQTTRDELACALGCPAARVSVVSNGVDTVRFMPRDASDPAVLAARRAARIEGPYVLYAARLEHPGKNHLGLLAAFAQSGLGETHRLVLAGADWGAGERIDREARRLAIAERVRRAGYLDDAVMPGLVAGADAVAMVGLAEGFGLPALEALAAGRALVAAHAGALPEVVGPNAIECDPRVPASIAAALTRAVRDEAFRARVAVDGVAWAARRDWDATAAGLLAECLAVRTS